MNKINDKALSKSKYTREELDKFLYNDDYNKRIKVILKTEKNIKNVTKQNDFDIFDVDRVKNIATRFKIEGNTEQEKEIDILPSTNRKIPLVNRVNGTYEICGYEKNNQLDSVPNIKRKNDILFQINETTYKKEQNIMKYNIDFNSKIKESSELSNEEYYVFEVELLDKAFPNTKVNSDILKDEEVYIGENGNLYIKILKNVLDKYSGNTSVEKMISLLKETNGLIAQYLLAFPKTENNKLKLNKGKCNILFDSNVSIEEIEVNRNEKEYFEEELESNEEESLLAYGLKKKL